MIKIQFGPQVSGFFNDSNPNMIFHIGAKSLIFKATPRQGISVTKKGKGYFFTNEVARTTNGVVVTLDGDAAQAFRNCFADLNNLVVQTGSEGRGNLDIVPGNNIFTQLLEPLAIIQDVPDNQEIAKARKKREPVQLIDVQADQESLAHCSLLYGTLWINNPRLGFSGYHSVFVLCQKTAKSTQYMGFHPNHFAVFSLVDVDLAGNRFREQQFNSESFYQKILQRYRHADSGSEIVQTILKLLKLRTQDQYSLQTTQVSLEETAIDNGEEELE